MMAVDTTVRAATGVRRAAGGKSAGWALRALAGVAIATMALTFSASAHAADKWLPQGMVLTEWLEDEIRYGAGLELYGCSDKVRSKSMGPELEQIRAHYGSYKRAMRVLANVDVP